MNPHELKEIEDIYQRQGFHHVCSNGVEVMYMPYLISNGEIYDFNLLPDDDKAIILNNIINNGIYLKNGNMDAQELAEIFVRNINEKHKRQVEELNAELEKHNSTFKIEAEPFLPNEWVKNLKSGVDTVVKNELEAAKNMIEKHEFIVGDKLYFDSPFGRYEGVVKGVSDSKVSIESHSPTKKGMMLADYNIEGIEWKKCK